MIKQADQDDTGHQEDRGLVHGRLATLAGSAHLPFDQAAERFVPGFELAETLGECGHARLGCLGITQGCRGDLLGFADVGIERRLRLGNGPLDISRERQLGIGCQGALEPLGMLAQVRAHLLGSGLIAGFDAESGQHVGA